MLINVVVPADVAVFLALQIRSVPISPVPKDTESIVGKLFNADIKLDFVVDVALNEMVSWVEDGTGDDVEKDNLNMPVFASQTSC
tara:strand:+ start:460 stop:714 length:255 start_codon:yes stop_codon:yes gene_type:complete